MLQLIIDQRENELKLHFQDQKNILFEMLDIGDIVFRLNNEPILVIERKTVTDLSSSICDGRYREQKIRLLGSGIDKSRIMYLIEGNITKKTKIKGGTDTLIGSLINTQFRDGIKVYKTNSLQETILFLQKLFKKLEKDHESFWNYENNHIISSSNYSATLKTKKKENMNPKVWFITQLALIPQVTHKIAETITDIYPTLRSLILAYENTNENNRELMLQNLTYQLSSGKSRRIGPKISSRIYEFLV